LTEAEQKKLRDAVQIMIAEKEWQGCRGQEMTDEVRVTIAALAAVMTLGFSDFYFDNVETILVYPTERTVKQERDIGGGATLVEENEALGQIGWRGPVVLSWAEICDNTIAQGYGGNLVFHEFAHKLDMLNGALDGTPNLPTNELARRWSRVMDKEYRRLQRAEAREADTLLDPYGAENPAEFFAVATECFFDAPQAMQRVYPPLYELFRDYFRQDPAAWREMEPPE
jgi:Mlc titration factor MtfA (ptsG expression regulator)